MAGYIVGRRVPMSPADPVAVAPNSSPPAVVGNPAMLVVTSNWCVSDGTLSAGPPRGFVERFRAEVRRSSLRCGFRRDGSYRPVDAVDVVLAGDTFDWLVSREWTGDVRPWDGGRRAAAALQRVAMGSLRRGNRLLAMLAGWMRRGIEVPVADRRGRPQAATRPVPVRVAVLCGDRDRRLEHVIAGSAAVAPGPVVGTTWSDGNVTVRHGAESDPLFAANGFDPALGDSIAVDLIGRFGVLLHDIAMLRPQAAGLLGRLAGGCPMQASRRLAGWLEAHDRGAALSEVTRKEVADAWHRSVALWHRAARRLPCCRVGGVDLVGQIAELLELAPDTPDPQRAQWFDGDVPMEVGDAATVVLGHPPADIGSSAVWRRQVICLGPRSCHARNGLDGDSENPAAVVVVSPGHADQRIDWLQMTAMKPFRHHEDGRGERGVWLSSETDDSRTLRRIVDAA